MNNWQDQFPLNTFHGETKKQLVEYFEGVLYGERRRAKRIIKQTYMDMCDELEHTTSADDAGKLIKQEEIMLLSRFAATCINNINL